MLFCQYTFEGKCFCIYRKYLTAVVIMLVILLFYDGFAPTLKGIYSERKRGESVLVEKAVMVIQNDYHGVWRNGTCGAAGVC